MVNNMKIKFDDGVVISVDENLETVEILSYGYNQELAAACDQVTNLRGLSSMIKYYNNQKRKQFSIINRKLNYILPRDVEIISPCDL